MKINNSIRKEAGSAIVVTMFMITLLAVSVAGYLTYVEHQSLLGARSQTWNLALGLSEAGVEEGLQHLNVNHANLNTDSWTADGTTYSIKRTLANGSYTVAIDNSNPNAPTITSRAFVTPPRFAQNAPPAMFAQAGGTQPTTTATTINRAVRVTTTKGSLFLASMVAKKGIDLKGNGVTSDSFDSQDPSKSTNGRWDSAKAGDHGDIASNDGVVSTVSVQQANIYGQVFTGPGGTATVGSQGGVGTHAWQAANNGFQPGYVLNTANFTFPDTTSPISSTAPPPPPGDVLTLTGIATNSTTYSTTTYPSAPASGVMGPVTTNTTTVSTTIYPGSGTAGLTTTTVNTTVASYPSSVPAGLSTNYTTTSTTTKTYPAAGTYQGGITTNVVTTGAPSGRGTWYIFNRITGIASYTYPVKNYSYPTYAYTYTVHLTTPTYTTNHYDHVIGNGDYYATSLSGTTVVTGKGRLSLPNGLNMSGGDGITVAPGGSIEIYSGGNSITIGGNGVMNGNGFAGNFIVYCADTVTDFTLNGNGEFTGVLVAPSAAITMNGGGNSRQDFTGALMAYSVRMNGHFNFHYDEALGRMGGNGRFLITSWAEVN
jgi:hypothetical protein